MLTFWARYKRRNHCPWSCRRRLDRFVNGPQAEPLPAIDSHPVVQFNLMLQVLWAGERRCPVVGHVLTVAVPVLIFRDD